MSGKNILLMYGSDEDIHYPVNDDVFISMHLANEESLRGCSKFDGCHTSDTLELQENACAPPTNPQPVIVTPSQLTAGIIKSYRSMPKIHWPWHRGITSVTRHIAFNRLFLGTGFSDENAG
ncbi:hypothetical protein P886_4481 [Alteromonadaceae bacterium 2753L.S.0a.02]|nr:hypothetical protein P886_4481 [Alteromonadaceae bacterium 2753L.S.0a.02]